MGQHREEEVEITTWPMSLESQFSSTRLREADIIGLEDIADAKILMFTDITDITVDICDAIMILLLTGQDFLEGRLCHRRQR